MIDLRSSGEIRLDGQGLLGQERLRIHHLPLFDGDVSQEHRDQAADMTLGDRYYGMLRFAGAPIARVFETLARADGPAVFHCAAGKDRTGVLAAIVLEMNGVEREAIIADFALTNERLEAVAQRLIRLRTYERGMRRISWQALQADPQTMRDFLLRVDESFGGPTAWAVANGLSVDSAGRLQRLLH